MSRIDLNIVATGNFTQVETQLARLKTQAAALSSTISGMSVFGPRATSDMQSSVRLFEDSLKSSGMFQTQMVNLRSETEKFGQSLQRGNLRLGDSFRIASGHIRNQQTAISKLAREQVRLMNSTTVAMGDGRQMVITPRGIDEAINKQQILNQEYRIFRQVVANGSTQLINWGKNTQWAGRQLTVGLTVPLTIFGATASKMFMDADKQLTRLAKVYGDASKGAIDPKELDDIRQKTLGLAKEISSTMGVAVDQTIGVAADLAATGKEGNELLEATSEAMRLSVLGEVDRQEAMKATLSIQSVFNQDTKELGDTINYLNAVENQTSTSLNDLVEGIVKAGPVVQGLGGDVKDLALMMVAMREGGIPAAEAANAIKSSLASLINPTKETRKLLGGFGIDLVSIVEKNAGNVTGTLVDLQQELSTLNDLSRQRAIEQIFGKFQFSRINALMSNLGKVGSQTEEVLKISGMSVQELAATAEGELTALTESASMKFTRAMEGLKASLIPIGEVFTKVGTVLIEIADKVLNIFNNLPDPVKNFINVLMILTALAGPLVMITGVLGNFFGYLIKGVSQIMAFKRAGRGVFEHFTPESIAARQATELLEKSVYDEKKAVDILNAALEKLSQTLDRMGGAANVAGSAMRDMAQDTLAGAESAAMVSGGMPKIFRSERDRYSYKGHEVSHLTSASQLENEYGFSKKSLQYLLSPTTVLGSQDVAEAKFQKVLGASFASSGYYDPSTMGTREQALLSMARDKAERDLVGMMSEGGMARLYPTMEEHTALVAKYQVSMEQLFSKNSDEVKRIMQEIDQAILDDDMPRAAAILRESIDAGDGRLEDLIAQRAMEYRQEFDRIVSEQVASGIDPAEARAIASREMQVSAARREQEILDTAPSGAGFANTGHGGRAGSGAAVFALAGGLPMSQNLLDATARRIQAENELANSQKALNALNKNLTTLTKDELVSRRNLAKELDVQAAYLRNGKEVFARVNGTWVQLTADGRQLKVTNQKTIAALEQRYMTEQQVAVANKNLEQANIEEANASRVSANADITEADASRRAAAADLGEIPASRGSRMSRLKGALGGGRGMMALSALSMATMFMPTGENEGMNTATDILGGAGMGASMGMMAGPWGALGGAIIGAAIPAVMSFSEAQQEANDAIVKYSEAINGSSIVLDKFAEEMGVLKPSEKLAAAIGQVASPEKVMEETSAILQTDAGKQLLEMSRNLGGQELVDTLSAQLKQLTLLEIFTPDQAKSVAQRLAMELGNPMLGQALVEGISEVIDSEGNLIADGISRMFLDSLPEIIIPDYDATQFAREYVDNMSLGDAMADAFLREDIFSPVGAIIGRAFGADTFTENQMQQGLIEYAQSTVPMVVSSLDKLREAQALTLSDFMSGQMTYEEYLSQMGSIREQTILAADALQDMRERGAPVTDLILDIARAAGREEEFKALEDQAKEIMGILSLGDETNSRFYTQIQIGAAYGDITQGELSNLLQMIQDPAQKNTIDSIFNIKGAEDNAIEIIKLLNMGMSADFVRNVSINSVEIGQPLDSIYASLVAISQLPPDTQKEIQARITGNPLELRNFVADYEYAMGLPDTRKELKAEVFGNDQLEFFQSNWEQFMDLPDVERKTAIFEYLVTGTYSFPEIPIATPQAVEELSMPSAQNLLSGSAGGGGGGGGSVDTSAIEEEFDKRIAQQDAIIEKIREEREEREKLLSLQEESLNFALKEQGLKDKIARAKAEGNLAEAALLQAELDKERKIKSQEERERLRKELEDKRIAEAEKAKEEIEKQKQEALDAARGSGGGGSGGSGGGVDEAEQKRIETRLQFLNDELNSYLTNNVEILDDIYENGARAFWDSEPIQRYIREAELLGIPLENIKSQLDSVYDELVNKGFGDQGIKEFDKVKSSLEEVGLSGESLMSILPNVFGIVRDTSLSESNSISKIQKAFEDAGMSTQEAEKRAKRFFKLVGQRRRFDAIAKFEEEFEPIKELLSEENAEIISGEFAEGMRKGLTRKQILSNISSSLNKAIYDDGVAMGLDPARAAERAQLMTEDMLDSVEERVSYFNSSDSSTVNFKGVYDDSALPEWMRDSRKNGTSFTADRMEREINLNVKADALPGSSLNTPSYVFVKNWPARSNNSGYSYSSFVTQSTGGYISGPGGPTSDIIPALLSNGEYVIRASSVDKYGINFLHALNQGMLPGAALGGMISKYPSAVRRMGGGGYIMNRYANGGEVNSKLAEYNISVNVAGTNASAEEIANTVMNTIKRRERMSGSVTRI